MTREHIPHRIVFAVVFAAASMLFVNQGSNFYLKYVDKTEYFTVRQPVTIDKHEYKPCDQILVDLVRTSSITSRAVSTVELILVNDKGEWTKQTVGGNDFIIDKSENQILHVNFNLPCTIKSGKYYLKAVVNYKVHEIEKNYIWESESFSVVY